MDTSLEIMKYSNLADAGYGQGLAPIGWEILKTSPVSSTGFAATAFRNIDTGELVVPRSHSSEWERIQYTLTN